VRTQAFPHIEKRYRIFLEDQKITDISPLYQRHPSPKWTTPSPTLVRSKTQMARPTSKTTRFAYFLFSSFNSACSGGTPKALGWTGIVSYKHTSSLDNLAKRANSKQPSIQPVGTFPGALIKSQSAFPVNTAISVS
jgi:hypothetical protein